MPRGRQGVEAEQKSTQEKGVSGSEEAARQRVKREKATRPERAGRKRRRRERCSEDQGWLKDSGEAGGCERGREDGEKRKGEGDGRRRKEVTRRGGDAARGARLAGCVEFLRLKRNFQNNKLREKWKGKTLWQ